MGGPAVWCLSCLRFLLAGSSLVSWAPTGGLGTSETVLDSSAGKCKLAHCRRVLTWGRLPITTAPAHRARTPESQRARVPDRAVNAGEYRGRRDPRGTVADHQRG